MPTLKNTIISEILSYLEHGDFCAEDFDTQFPNSSTLAKLTFRPLPKYTFTLEEKISGGALAASRALSGSESPKMVLSTTEKPGDFKTSETKTHNGIKDATSRIYFWLQNIREDIINSRQNIRTSIDEITENFQKSIDETIKDQESFFKEEEITSIREKLEELQKRITDLEHQLHIPEEKTKPITAAIESSKENLSIYPKGVWYKTSGTKIIKYLQAALGNKEVQGIIAEITKKLLQ